MKTLKNFLLRIMEKLKNFLVKNPFWGSIYNSLFLIVLGVTVVVVFLNCIRPLIPTENEFLCNLTTGNLSYTDVIGYFLGIMSFFVAYAISLQLGEENTKWQIEQNQMQQEQYKIQREQYKINAQIRRGVTSLQDSSRKIMENFSEIFSEFKRILTEINKEEYQIIQLYFSNPVLAFGKIHAYNYNFVCRDETQPAAINPSPLDTEIVINKVNKFNKGLDEVFFLFDKAARSAQTLRILTYDNTRLSDFFKEYCDVEQHNLFFVKPEESKVVYCLDEKDYATALEHVLELHNEYRTMIDNTIKSTASGASMRNSLKTQHSGIREFKKNNNPTAKLLSDKISMLQLLVKYQHNKSGAINFETLIMYFEDLSDIESENMPKERQIVGFSTNNDVIFKSIENVFNEKFDSPNAQP